MMDGSEILQSQSSYRYSMISSNFNSIGTIVGKLYDLEVANSKFYTFPIEKYL